MFSQYKKHALNSIPSLFLGLFDLNNQDANEIELDNEEFYFPPFQGY